MESSTNNKTKAPRIKLISADAVVRRINRRLRSGAAGPPGRLIKPRSASAIQQLGEYYVVDDRNAVSASHVDVAELARELGALQRDERIQAC